MSLTPRRMSKSILSLLRAAAHSTLLASLLASMLLLPGLPLTAQALENDMRYPATLELLGKFGNVRILGEGRAFIPLWQTPDNLLYLDLRGMGDDESNAEGNFGAAFRHMFNETWILGGYGFFDYRSSDLGDNNFLGGLVGFEALSTNWDFHANGYFPEGGSKSAPFYDRTVATFPNIAVRRGREIALFGVDGEIGWRLPFSDESLFWDTRVYAGGYYFDNNGVKAITGPQGRFEIRFHDPFPFLPKGSRITVGGGVQWDQVRDVQGGGSVALRVPIYNYGGTPPGGESRLSRLQRRMLDPIRRDQDIVTNIKGGRTDPVYNVKTGERILYAIYADDSTNGVGTPTNPAEIDEAIALAMEDSIVVALDNTGPIDTNDTAASEARLLDGQILMGGGETIKVMDATGRQFGFTAQGRRGNLVNFAGNGDPIVRAARNNLITGLDFGGSSFGGEGGLDWIGIQADDPGASPLPGVFGGLMVTQSTFTDIGLRGIDIRSGGGEGQLGDYSWEVGIMNNEFIGDFQAINIDAATSAARLDISRNRFNGLGTPRAARVQIFAETADVKFQRNSLEGYENGLFSQFLVGALDLSIASNHFDVGSLEELDQAAEGIGFGDQAIFVDANAFVLDAEVNDNRVTGYGQNCGEGCNAAVEILARAENQLDLEVANNRIELSRQLSRTEGGGPDGIGLNVLTELGYLEAEGESEGPDLDLRVNNNTVDGYAGLFFGGAAAVNVAAGIGFGDTASVEVNRNDITAPQFPQGEGGDLSPFGYQGLNVSVIGQVGVVAEGGGVYGGAADVDVSNNDVNGFSGGGDFGGDAAVEVDVRVDRGEVTVTNNDITAPRPDLFGPQAGPGLNVFALANGGLEIVEPEPEPEPGAEGDEPGEDRDPAVLVSRNRVVDYTGATFDERRVEGPGGLAAVNVFSDGNFLTEVSNNTISAPEEGEEFSFPTGTGLLVVASGDDSVGFQDVAVEVLDNDVDRFGQLGYIVAGSEGGGGLAPAVIVAAIGGLTGTDDVSVEVSRNRINAKTNSEVPSPVGLLVQARGGQQVDVTVDDNDVTDYNGYGFFGGNEGGDGLAAVIVAAEGQTIDDGESYSGDLDVEVTDNTITAPEEQLSAVGLSVGLFDFETATANVSRNTVDGYLGMFEAGALDVTVDGANPATVVVEDNRVIAPSVEPIGPEGFVTPTTGISVFSSAFDAFPNSLMSISVLDNDVDGYFGVAGIQNGQFGATPAGISVTALSANGGDILVDVDNNDVTAPDTEVDTGPGISIFADALGFFESGTEGDPNGDVSVLVTDNRVTDYSGTFGHAAVEVNASGDEVSVLVGTDEEGANRGNRVRAPSQGGTVGIDVIADGRVATVEIENNDVDGYGRATNPAAEGEREPEVSSGSAIRVRTFGLASDVSASNNDVDAPSQGGRTGIFAETFTVSSNTTLSNNNVTDYSNGLNVNSNADSVIITVLGNDVRTTSESGLDGLFLRAVGASFVDANVEDNTIDGSPDDGMDLRVEGTASDAQMRVVDNRVTDSGGEGINVTNSTDETVDATIGGNRVARSGDNGILLVQNAGGELAVTSDVDGTIENNDVDDSADADLATSGNVTGTIRVNNVDETLPLP